MRTKNIALQNEILNTLKEAPNQSLRWSELYETLRRKFKIGKATLVSHLKDLIEKKKVERIVDDSHYPPTVYYKAVELERKPILFNVVKDFQEAKLRYGIEFTLQHPNEEGSLFTNLHLDFPEDSYRNEREFIKGLRETMLNTNKIIRRVREIREIVVKEQKRVLTAISKRKNILKEDLYKELLRSNLPPIKILIGAEIWLDENEFPQLKKLKEEASQ